ncbi:MAG: hypothetical protein GWM90_13810, partial [Gemmatimonadetes bacterium]|nr:hypothetical protein [Gemmatimonadota bacterium]NIU75370.1 hypothetical protein [Gammaproteobacteria bacterium]NIX45146.1 hypothetical protein [Gemmatimonadota bacterium]
MMTDERDVNDDEKWLEAVVAHLSEPVDRTPGVVDAVVAAATEGRTPSGAGARETGGQPVPSRARG